MRTLAFISLFALQLSIFTCGFDIHVHAMDADVSHVAEHLHDDDNNHEQGSPDHSCHVHASHSFTTFNLVAIGVIPVVSPVQHHLLSEPYLKNLSFLIEHPPKLFRS